MLAARQEDDETMMCTCMSVCAYIYVYVQVYVYVNAGIYVYKYICAYIYIYIYVETRIYIYIDSKNCNTQKNVYGDLIWFIDFYDMSNRLGYFMLSVKKMSILYVYIYILSVS